MVFGDMGPLPRLNHNLKVKTVRPTRKDLSVRLRYPDKDAVIPVGSTVPEIITGFPLHVHGDVLKIFLAERHRWCFHDIWQTFPPDFKTSGLFTAADRSSNGLSQALSRQAEKVAKEQAQIEERAYFAPPKIRRNAETRVQSHGITNSIANQSGPADILPALEADEESQVNDNDEASSANLLVGHREEFERSDREDADGLFEEQASQR